MSGVSIAFAVAGCALFGVALLFISGVFAIGLSLTAVADAVPADHAKAEQPRLPQGVSTRVNRGDDRGSHGSQVAH
jgi:hypothetical protein